MSEQIMTNRICVYGIVQGVGFRPFVSRIALDLGVTGSVANKGSYVEIFVQCSSKQQNIFLERLTGEAPERSAILKVDSETLPEEIAPEFSSFEIIESEHEEGDIFVSPDIATCPECRRELYDPNNRRYMHPFINCTACGPRLTILDAMPYDRERTSMKEFPMCPECEFEYTHPETRRYDAQPVCCNDCGPEVYLLTAGDGKELVRGRDAITAARRSIMNGQIIAIKGIGGFHLCCNARNEEAVARLRLLKRRPAKPFAVMMRDMETVEKYCVTEPEQQKILDGPQKPIILLKMRRNTPLAPSVAPDNPKLGVMLPYAPVQMLLFDYNDDIVMDTDCFVMTSGNISGAPICRTDEDALKEIAGFCDVILSHNRKIRLRADDSVMDFYGGNPYMIRRSRGYAPLPVMMHEGFDQTVLAVGGELKNTFCIGKNQLFYPSPYVGDMADLRTVRALEESIQRMEELLEAKPSIVACDLHPKYNTTLVAEEQGLPVLKLQHHYAHILSCMAENDIPTDHRVLGVSFDGTGYGTDETVWGGEFLVCDGYDFKRAGSIVPFLHIGGDLAAKEGFRIALSMLNGLKGESAAALCEHLPLNRKLLPLIRNMAAKHINAIPSTSAGRLFDAVSAILGVRQVSSFEGEASTTLMFRAMSYESESLDQDTDPRESLERFLKQYPELLIPRKGAEDRWLMPTDRLTEILAEAMANGEDPSMLAYVFHSLLAKQIVAMCRIIAEEEGLHDIALSGGVFQNCMLLKFCDQGLSDLGYRVLRHSLIPPNDGGLALGQAYGAMAALMRQKDN